MTRQETLTRLQKIFEHAFGRKFEISEELEADRVMGWDSLTHMAIMLQIEKSFSIRFSLSEMEKGRKMSELIDLILKKQPAK